MDEIQLKSSHKITLITNIIKDLQINQLNVSQENKENIKKFINYFIVKDYLLLDNNNVILGLPAEATSEPNLSYTERKVVKEYIESIFVKVLQPLIEKLKENEANGINSNENEKLRQKFITQQKELQLNQLLLLEYKKEKIKLMNEIAQIRAGPEQKQIVENLYNATKLNNLKTEVLKKILSNKIIDSTTHAVKAFKTVEKYIDMIIESKKNKENI
uniref:CSON013188 protein n=1 Tax=Culicoides sonorensis TaxID=179676 RepID=A0A336M7F7_CULSO